MNKATPLSFTRGLRRMAAGLFVSTAIASSSLLNPAAAQAQAKKEVFQTGEELTYKVKFGFVKLGTVVIKTGGSAPEFGPNKVKAQLRFWTADVPFLDAKSTVNNVIDTRELYVKHFEQTGNEGKQGETKSMTFDKEKKTLTYSDAKVKDKVTENVNPFSDALTLVFNMRAWSGSGQRYAFPMRGKDGENKVTVNFTKKTENLDVEAFEEDVKTRIAEGQLELGDSAPLGANGKFKAWFTDDNAGIPVKMDMSIAIGSITLELVKVKRSNWEPQFAKN